MKNYTLKEVKAIRNKIKVLGDFHTKAENLREKRNKFFFPINKYTTAAGILSYFKKEYLKIEVDLLENKKYQSLFNILKSICPEAQFFSYCNSIKIAKNEDEDWIITLSNGKFLTIDAILKNNPYSIWVISKNSLNRYIKKVK